MENKKENFMLREIKERIAIDHAFGEYKSIVDEEKQKKLQELSSNSQKFEEKFNQKSLEFQKVLENGNTEQMKDFLNDFFKE